MKDSIFGIVFWAIFFIVATFVFVHGEWVTPEERMLRMEVRE